MNGETDADTEVRMIRIEQMEEGKIVTPESGESPKSPKKLMIDEVVEGRESGMEGVGSLPRGSFPSLSSSQSSGSDKMISYVSPIGKVRVLKFEDPLSEEDHRGFNIIYESLLLEGRVSNLTDLMMGMVLAEKPPAWLQVMHERLKHLIISSKTFKEKKRAEHIAQAGVKK